LAQSRLAKTHDFITKTVAVCSLRAFHSGQYIHVLTFDKSQCFGLYHSVLSPSSRNSLLAEHVPAHSPPFEYSNLLGRLVSSQTAPSVLLYSGRRLFCMSGWLPTERLPLVSPMLGKRYGLRKPAVPSSDWQYKCLKRGRAFCRSSRLSGYDVTV